jgi:predicted AAA+ superfamily ATPase
MECKICGGRLGRDNRSRVCRHCAQGQIPLERRLEIAKKRRETYERSLGVANPAKSPRVQEKTKQTNLERYGSECVFGSKEIQDRIAKTNRGRYGASSVLAKDSRLRPQIEEKILQKTEESQAKILKTNLERYDFASPLQNEEVAQKTRQTNLARYGHESAQSSPEVRQRIRSAWKSKSPEYLEELLRVKANQALLSRLEAQLIWSCLCESEGSGGPL